MSNGLSTALSYFAQAIKDIANGLYFSITYFLNLFGIQLDKNIATLLTIVCIVYAVQMVVKDELIKKLALFLLILVILGYIGLNIEEIVKLGFSFVPKH